MTTCSNTYTSDLHSKENAIFIVIFKTKANFGPSAKYLPVRKFNLAHGLVDNQSLKTLWHWTLITDILCINWSLGFYFRMRKNSKTFSTFKANIFIFCVVDLKGGSETIYYWEQTTLSLSKIHFTCQFYEWNIVIRTSHSFKAKMLQALKGPSAAIL